ncbi:type VI-A CRISPR-associated RNA-guided ribonuclease Cas13a [Pinisolibacter sp.]|uniref:type VI-A CRISPR-associated RNA-guided ribonuclease Cas13a n=1 Tax=Pinisolibacter sp. TaxID=2172024 RepID=UPI002FDEC518
MQILKPIGRSSTRYAIEKNTFLLRRFLADRYLDAFSNELAVPIEDISVLRMIPIDEGRELVRQAASLFNKTVKSSRLLRNMDMQTYVDRVFLSQELIKYILDAVNIRDGAEFSSLKELWVGLVHPYASHEIDNRSPSEDKNAAIIKKFGLKDATRVSFNGRWHDAFWVLGKNGKPDYAAIALNMMTHLVFDEMKINGDLRQCRNKYGEFNGAIVRRALSIFTSTHDPRFSSNRTISDFATEYYFYKDVAEEIFGLAHASESKDVRLTHKEAGRVLYEHFGGNPNAGSYKEFDREIQKQIWELHNKVRSFYADALSSVRFVRIFDKDGARRNEIISVIPPNKLSLLARLKVRSEKRDLVRMVRLGKAVVHALDKSSSATDEEAQGAFNVNLDFLLTSEGQAEIKRVESFARAWRESVGLSCRTIGVWSKLASAPPKKDGTDWDVTEADYAKKRVPLLSPETDIRPAARLIFGDKQVGRGKTSRLEAILATESNPTEILWGFVRLNSEMRNASAHFNTRKRFVELIQDSIIKPLKAPTVNYENRGGNEVALEALEAFGRLLQFDESLVFDLLEEEIKSLRLDRFAADADLKALVREASPNTSGSQIATPKFMSLMERAVGLATSRSEFVPDELQRFARLNLAGLSSRSDEDDVSRIGALRLVYGRGFERWLTEHLSDSSQIRQLLRRIGELHTKRRLEYDSAHNRPTQPGIDLLERIDIDSISSLEDLARRLTIEAMTDSSLATRARRASRNRYEQNVLTDERRQRSGQVELVRQEIYGCLFARYLNESGLDWIFADFPEPKDVAVPFEIGATTSSHHPSWHASFYGWLYLLPPDDVALLRHQFKKTAALEERAEDGLSPDDMTVLYDIDGLMALYVSVQSAGFGGREHAIDVKPERGAGTDRSVYYEDTSQFARVFSEDKETHRDSVPGTRRGLRQLRFENIPSLLSIFEKHRVTVPEVESFMKKAGPDNAIRVGLLEEKTKLRNKLADMAKSRDSRPFMAPDVERYRSLAGELARYDFEINAARLTEFSRLYRLAMRIIGRLNDFTLMWERDRLYMLMGMLYEKLGAEGFRVEVKAWNNGTEQRRWIAIAVGDGASSGAIDEKPPSRAGDVSTWMLRKYSCLPIWDSRFGIVAKGTEEETKLLSPEDRIVFVRHFVGAEAENPRDIEARRDKPPAPPRRGADARSWRNGKAKIRNDFAHYNMLGSSVKILNLTYRVNAVRSLFGYDRKMKNVVSKAISDILLDEGLAIRWKMREDRLRGALVLPLVRKELAFLGLVDGKDLSIDLPQVSVRFTSMVQALFGFDSGGHRELVETEGKLKARGRLTYPREFLARHGDRLPKEVLSEYPSLPQK